MNPYLILAVWFVFFNALAAYATARDKRAARLNHRRIPEANLLFLAFLGGAIGEWITMYVIHHKTRKPRFVILVPLMAILQIAGVILLLLYWGGIL